MKQEKYIFLSLLSPSKALYSFSFCVSSSAVFSCSIPPASHFVLLSPKPLILLLLPHTRSLILNLFFPLYRPFSIVLHVPLCYPPPPFSPLCLSHLNMPPLTITLSHTQDDCSTPFSSPPSLQPFFFCFSPVVFFVIIHTSPFYSAHHVFSSWCSLSNLAPNLNVTFATNVSKKKQTWSFEQNQFFSMQEKLQCYCRLARAGDRFVCHEQAQAHTNFSHRGHFVGCDQFSVIWPL